MRSMDPGPLAARSSERAVRRSLPRSRAVVAAVMLATALAVALAPSALAHPLGNFTINHYAGLRVGRDSVAVDVVIDEAEIPTFEARLEIDVDGDGDVSEAEARAAREPRCEALRPSLSLDVGGRRGPLELTAAGLSFPRGAGGLSTMRLVCEFEAGLSPPLSGPTRIAFADTSFAGQLGWREITAVGDGTALHDAPGAESVSTRLTSYPTSLLRTPLAEASVAFEATPGGPPAAPFVAPDADRVAAPPAEPGSSPPSTASVSSPSPAAAAPAERTGPGAPASPGSVPGGIGSEIDDLLRTNDLTPLVVIGSLLAAIALGAGHALTPGHGKTLIGAYVVGTSGTTADALALGLAVAAAHTLGIVVLGGVVLGAGSALPPATFARLAPVVSAVTLTAVGAWLLLGHARRLLGDGEGARSAHTHAIGHTHASHSHAEPLAGLLADQPARPPRRGLFLVGLAGGLVPSTNALLILLATIATNRPAFGLVLVVAFGLGMAAVMTGVALSVSHARDLLSRIGRLRIVRLATWGPPLAAAFVVVLGLVLTVESLAPAPL